MFALFRPVFSPRAAQPLAVLIRESGCSFHFLLFCQPWTSHLPPPFSQHKAEIPVLVSLQCTVYLWPLKSHLSSCLFSSVLYNRKRLILLSRHYLFAELMWHVKQITADTNSPDAHSYFSCICKSGIYTLLRSYFADINDLIFLCPV